MERIDQFQKFGRDRNTIMHFAVPEEDWSGITPEFLMRVVEPLLQQLAIR